ncbi:hypothetical protein DFP72DRAFT_853532 [Ephemerocybe angulata]|uniref:Uncharacterized protein n=1 Tax=Ephemerocybe angulata TaxID=980116 RepID=A0A8H6M1P0_9AGAR|nr:hypothetical protein DFP72DRAFT_853532 [Tulosesus angulatus]
MSDIDPIEALVSPLVLIPHLDHCFPCRRSTLSCRIPTSTAADEFADHAEACRTCHQRTARCLNAELESDAVHLPIPATIAEHQAPTPPKRTYSPQMELLRSHLRICKPCRQVADACGVTTSKYLGPYSKHIETCTLCRASTRACIGVTTEHQARKHRNSDATTGKNDLEAEAPERNHQGPPMEIQAQGFAETFRIPILLLVAYGFALIEYELVAVVIGALAIFL